MPELDDHDDVPIDGAVRIHPDVCISWARSEPGGELSLLVWHWCTRALWRVRPGAVVELCVPQWSAAGVSAHTLVSRDPLHLEPSLLWPDCCGMHGFIRAGTWVPA